MTEGVTKRYELTATRAVVLDVISSNITDPLTGQQARSSTTKWIFDGEPEKKLIGQGSGGIKFPMIVFAYPEMDSEIVSLDQSKSKIEHSLPIETHARTKLQANELAEQVKYILEVTGIDDLRTGCLHLVGINGTSDDKEWKAGADVYIKTIDYQFKRFD